tara:strand:+ start:125 stop:577 length:453 start_codon:yes stop_codon:yes gene_type:complete
MKKLIALIFLLFSSSISALPDCPSNPNEYFNNCYGTWTASDGYRYVGEWVDDKQHGEGTAYYPNGDTFVGEFAYGKRINGTYTHTSGDSYTGETKDGEMHGYGEYTFAGGRVLKGYFYEDKFIPRICTDMGLAEQTESFGDCVVELIKKL